MPAIIGKREVGEGHPAFITFEAGATHSGLESAKVLVDAAAAAGADAVKFQMMEVDRLIADRSVSFGYKVLKDREKNETEAVEEPLWKILRRRELSRGEWRDLKGYCDSRKIAFVCTAMFPEEVDFLVDDLGVNSLKLASGDINHFPLLAHMARKGVNIQLDTGSAELWEIERAVAVIESEKNRNIVIHLCPTGYPARLESIHLRMIATLKMLFPEYAVGFSDHSPGWEMDIAAVALGAHLVEKTITEDKETRSCEHMFSLEPAEAGEFVTRIGELETAMGRSRRTIPAEVREQRKKVRRSIFAGKALRKGDRVEMSDVDFRRPGGGIGPEEIAFVLGKTLLRDKAEGEILSLEDLC